MLNKLWASLTHPHTWLWGEEVNKKLAPPNIQFKYKSYTLLAQRKVTFVMSDKDMQKQHHFQKKPIYLTLNGPGRYWWNPVGLPKKAAIQEKEKAMHYTIRPLLWSYTLPLRCKDTHICTTLARLVYITTQSSKKHTWVLPSSHRSTFCGSGGSFFFSANGSRAFHSYLRCKVQDHYCASKKHYSHQSSLKPFLGKKWTGQKKRKILS